MKHADQILDLLRKQIGNEEEVRDISRTAKEVTEKWVDPLSGGEEEINGLVYGLVQSGKTGVLTVTGAMGADEGYRAIIILTSDNDPLYEQTLGRVKEAYPGMDILGKNDFKDTTAFLQRIKGGTSAIVTTKNGSRLKTLIENFKAGRVKGLTCLIIDDEADQASLNTSARRSDGTVSKINGRITELRTFFSKNTYLQVTATPQSLFLQGPDHSFRPKFTVLSHPGHDYVGGEDFFGEGSNLVREFELNDITILAPGPQPAPSKEIPRSLMRALDTFMIGATFKRMNDAEQNCAFLCHVSTRKSDHNHIVDLLRLYKTKLANALRSKDARVVERLRNAYDDLASSHEGIKGASFDRIIDAIEFYSPGITVKLVNGETDEDVAVRQPYNLFVGGNKLGRGVTIKNLLVSYYGRNPRNPQADTVLQHARMYGYRRKDIGLLRLFLPPELHVVFKAINKMEKSLRDLIAKNSGEEFRGIYVESGLNPTRKNVLAPGSIGVYSGGSNYNPAQILRNESIDSFMEKIDRTLDKVRSKSYAELSVLEIQALIGWTRPDPRLSEHVWNPIAISSSIEQFAKIKNHTTGYVYVDRDRALEASRSETAGILTGGEFKAVPNDKVALYLLRTDEKRGKTPAWWPQVRFPDGRYAFAFAI
ncbi:MAG: Z1 domain-containing protein [Xanthobacteraceae bacterium]